MIEKWPARVIHNQPRYRSLKESLGNSSSTRHIFQISSAEIAFFDRVQINTYIRPSPSTPRNLLTSENHFSASGSQRSHTCGEAIRVRVYTTTAHHSPHCLNIQSARLPGAGWYSPRGHQKEKRPPVSALGDLPAAVLFAAAACSLWTAFIVILMKVHHWPLQLMLLCCIGIYIKIATQSVISASTP